MDRNCVFIGGKQIGFNCLKILLKVGIVPKLVIGNFDDLGKDSWHQSLVKFALENDLSTIKKRKVKDTSVYNKIREINPEIIFCIGGTQIIPKKVLDIPKIGCLNLHPALLPKYRGRFSTVHAIFNGEKYTGVTAHWMDEGIDSGPVIFQKRIKIDKNDTAKSLYDKFTKEGSILFAKIVDLWLKGQKIISTPQNEKQATFYLKTLPNNGEINWNWDGGKILRFIKAMIFEPFPPATFKIGDKEMVIVDKKYFKGFEK
ncbi:methionyl-tRNA formyltransferase [Patescibacteria group bacterium]|nr:methionyl-tRNA formyltransferase [Patescibacteria group bacterium]